MKVIAIVNVGAGAVRRLGVAQCRDRLAAAFDGAGVSAEVEFVESAEVDARAENALRAARAGALDAVVVGGGDGTIRAVAAVFAGSGIAVGVLPFGTLNHFARDLGIPLDLARAVATIAAGNVRAIDVGEVNGELFINNSSVGIYPHMVADRERRQSTEGRAKWTAMALAALRMARRFPRRRLTVHTGGVVREYRTPILFVGNNQYGAGFLSFGRGKTLDRGLLYLYVARPQHWPGLLWLAIRAFLGSSRLASGLDTIEVQSAEVRARGSRLLVALDGEVRTMPTPLRYRARPADLRVFAPPPTPEGAPGTGASVPASMART